MNSMSAKSDPEKPCQEQLLKQIDGAGLAQLMAIWAGRSTADWTDCPEVYRDLTRNILRNGEPLLAYDVVAEGLKLWPGDVGLRQLQGLALSRSGATERANAVLQELRNQGASDEETLGMLGRTYKDLAALAEPAERKRFLESAAKIYGEAYERSGGYYTGINAATTSLLIGDEGRACAI